MLIFFFTAEKTNLPADTFRFVRYIITSKRDNMNVLIYQQKIIILKVSIIPWGTIDKDQPSSVGLYDLQDYVNGFQGAQMLRQQVDKWQSLLTIHT